MSKRMGDIAEPSTKRLKFGEAEGNSESSSLEESEVQMGCKKISKQEKTNFLYSPSDFKEARISTMKQAVVQHLTTLFKSIYSSFNVTDYLHPEKLFRELDPNIFYRKTRGFLRSFPKMQKLSGESLEAILQEGIFAFFCFNLSVHLHPLKLPESSDESINEFLTFIRYFCHYFRKIGLPTENEEPLLSALIFLQTNTLQLLDDEIITAARRDVEALLEWVTQQNCTRFGRKVPINVRKFIVQVQPYLEVCRNNRSLPNTLQFLFINGN